jgi:stage V sporulation protein B
MGIAIVFNSVVLVTTAIMQAHGYVNRPVVNMLLGGLVKLVAVYVLTGNPIFGIVGTPIGTLLCYLCICVLNILSIRHLFNHPPAIVKNLLRAFLSAAVMGAVTFAAWFGLKQVFDSRLILCGAPIAVGVLVYAFLAVRLKAITREDCLLLPKGEKIANLLHL